MSNPQEVQFDKPFILHVKIKVENGTHTKLLSDWLDKEGFKYDFERHNLYNHIFILCDNLTDGAKIETFIQTPNNNG